MRLTLPPQIPRDNLALLERLENRILDLLRVLGQTHVLQHHDTAQQQRRRVRQPFARNVRRGTMYRLEDRALIADIPRRRETQPTDEAGAHVGEDVAV